MFEKLFGAKPKIVAPKAEPITQEEIDEKNRQTRLKIGMAKAIEADGNAEARLFSAREGLKLALKGQLGYDEKGPKPEGPENAVQARK